jgi:hypothetical protein
MRTVLWNMALFFGLLAVVLVGGLLTRRLGSDQALILMVAPWVCWGFVALARRRSNNPVA